MDLPEKSKYSLIVILKLFSCNIIINHLKRYITFKCVRSIQSIFVVKK